MGTNTTYLSNAVNCGLGCNLKFLINWYRVEHAKMLLEGPLHKMRSLPAICGFASKSAFYASFRKVTGVTPFQYAATQKHGRRTEQERNKLANRDK